MSGKLNTRSFSKSKGPRANPLFSHTKKKSEPWPLWKILASDIAAGVGALCGMFFLIWYVTIRSSFFYFDSITVHETTYIPHDQLVSVVDDYLASHRLFGLPTRSYPYFSSQALTKKIHERFDAAYAINTVTITTTLPDKLTVTVSERVPSVVWRLPEAQNNAYYMIDREGIVAQYVDRAESLPSNLPIIRDENHTEIQVGELVTSKKYIEFILSVYDTFTPSTGLPVLSFTFPKIECQELQYVIEQIFEDEISGAVSDEFKQKKLDIQQKFKDGQLTIDQSLDALDAVKQEEITANGGTNTTMPKVRWQQVSVTVPCDYSAVSKELHVQTQSGENTFSVYLDAQMDIQTQLYNFTSSIASGRINADALEYFDARYEDRAYYKEK